MDTSYYIAARDELLSRLRDAFFHPIYRYYGTLWFTSVSESQSLSDHISTFRGKLSDVRNWTTTKINDEFQKVTKGSESVFDLLVTRTFTINARILTFAAEVPPSYITINVPDNRRFVHMVYINAAREFYMNPFLFSDNGNEAPYRRMTVLKSTIDGVIDKTIRELQSLDSIFNGSSTTPSIISRQSVSPAAPPVDNFNFTTSAPDFPYEESNVKSIPREEELTASDSVSQKNASIDASDDDFDEVTPPLETSHSNLETPKLNHVEITTPGVAPDIKIY